jgi:hypothetical protein
VLQLLIDDFSKAQQLKLSPDEIEAFEDAMRAAAKRAAASQSQPIPEPAYDEDVVQGKLREVREKLAAADSLLEKLTLQGQEQALERAIELKSRFAVAAYEHLLPLRLEAGLYKRYGGKVVARQISLQAAGARLALAEQAQTGGQLVFHDEALKQAFWRRLRDDCSHPAVPPERVDFSLPVWLQAVR